MKSSDYVVLKLEGGLGNQLFQLAAGYYLAAKLNTNLLIDQYAVPLTTAHGEKKNQLESFYIETVTDDSEIIFLSNLPSRLFAIPAKHSKLLKRILLKFRMLTSNSFNLPLFIERNDNTLEQGIHTISFPVKLHGNFQSWDIVEKASEFGFPRILQLRDKPIWISKLEDDIHFKESIVLHFRVGADAQANLSFRQPELTYYLRGLEILKERKADRATYILSDNVKQVKEMFGLQLGEEVNYLEMPNHASPAERLYVLSLFGGIVCANSTFCGWAAWSIYNSGGDVVVPVPYSDGPVLGSRDFPSKWVQLNKYSGAVGQ